MSTKFQQGSLSLGLRQVRRVVVFVVGMTVLLVGCVLILTPGPGLVGVAAGLAILGLEFAWARRWLAQARQVLDTALRRRRGAEPAPAASPKSREKRGV